MMCDGDDVLIVLLTRGRSSTRAPPVVASLHYNHNPSTDNLRGGVFITTTYSYFFNLPTLPNKTRIILLEPGLKSQEPTRVSSFEPRPLFPPSGLVTLFTLFAIPLYRFRNSLMLHILRAISAPSSLQFSAVSFLDLNYLFKQ